MDFEEISGFDWDVGNARKNWAKHKVRPSECEEVFFNSPLLIDVDEEHSGLEDRFYAFGKTNHSRLLYVVYTVREKKIRIISAREMTKKERESYYGI